MVIVPVRAGPLLGSAVNWTDPPPSPAVPLVIRAQARLLAAVHVHEAGAVTDTAPPPPCAATVCAEGLMAYEQPPACAMVTDRPATVAVPVRAPPLFAATLSWTDPSPVPPAPPGTVIQGTLDAALQRHPSALSTRTATASPDAGTLRCSGVTAYEQDSA